MMKIAYLVHHLTLISVIIAIAPLKRVVVVGGGAAGYFSAVECARQLSLNKVHPYEVRKPHDLFVTNLQMIIDISMQVLILEAGKEPLSKVAISGGGRCNVMHDPVKGPKEIAKVKKCSN